MKAILLAGGLGTRISEESTTRPKPMIEIGGKPILWHILKMYSRYGINDFVICCGYKGYVIKEYFANYFLHTSDVTFDLKTNSMKVHQNSAEPWSITVLDTGLETMTGGRLKRVEPYLTENEDFCFTYGDGVSDVDIGQSLKFHKNHGKMATVTVVQPPGRFGMVNFEGTKVLNFTEKPSGDGAFINGGFFVLNKKVLKYLKDDSTIWEREPMEQLARQGEMQAFVHKGFWQPMDTLRDKTHLEDLWKSNQAPWKTWT